MRTASVSTVICHSLCYYNKLQDCESFIQNRNFNSFLIGAASPWLRHWQTKSSSRLKSSLLAWWSLVAASSEERDAVSSEGEGTEDWVSRTWREASVEGLISTSWGMPQKPKHPFNAPFLKTINTISTPEFCRAHVQILTRSIPQNSNKNQF